MSLSLLLCSLRKKHIRDKPNCFIHNKNNWFIQKRIHNLEKDKPYPACRDGRQEGILFAATNVTRRW